MCAERNALSTMITNGEIEIDTVIAVNKMGKVLPPCGACREFMWQLSNSNDIKVVYAAETNLFVDFFRNSDRFCNVIKLFYLLVLNFITVILLL